MGVAVLAAIVAQANGRGGRQNCRDSRGSTGARGVWKGEERFQSGVRCSLGVRWVRNGPELETKGVRVAPVQSLEALWWLWVPHVRVAAQAFGGRGAAASLRLRLLGALGSHGCSSLLLHLQVAWTGGTSRWLGEDGMGGGGRELEEPNGTLTWAAAVFTGSKRAGRPSTGVSDDSGAADDKLRTGWR